MDSFLIDIDIHDSLDSIYDIFFLVYTFKKNEKKSKNHKHNSATIDLKDC